MEDVKNCTPALSEAAGRIRALMFELVPSPDIRLLPVGRPHSPRGVALLSLVNLRALLERVQRPPCRSPTSHAGCCPPDCPDGSGPSSSRSRRLVALLRSICATCSAVWKTARNRGTTENPTELANPRSSYFTAGWRAAPFISRSPHRVWAWQHG